MSFMPYINKEAYVQQGENFEMAYPQIESKLLLLLYYVIFKIFLVLSVLKILLYYILWNYTSISNLYNHKLIE